MSDDDRSIPEGFRRAAAKQLFVADVHRRLADMLPDDETTLTDLGLDLAALEPVVADAARDAGISLEVAIEILRAEGLWE